MSSIVFDIVINYPFQKVHSYVLKCTKYIAFNIHCFIK